MSESLSLDQQMLILLTEFDPHLFCFIYLVTFICFPALPPNPGVYFHEDVQDLCALI